MRSHPHFTLIILCGGQGRRMGDVDKGWLTVDDKPFIQRLLERYGNTPNVTVLISANQHLEQYANFGHDVIGDLRTTPCGPLAGIEACIARAPSAPVVIIPCDMPNLPADLPARLLAALATQHGIAAAHDGQRLQPLCCAFYPDYWRADLSAQLDRGHYGVARWLKNKPVTEVRFSATSDFLNINSPDDIPLPGHDMSVTSVTTGKIRYTCLNDRYTNNKSCDLTLASRIS